MKIVLVLLFNIYIFFTILSFTNIKINILFYSIFYIYIFIYYRIIYLNFNIILLIQKNFSLHKVEINKGFFFNIKNLIIMILM